MRILAMDTSTPICSVALWQGGNVAERAIAAAEAHGEHVLPMLQALLAQAGLGLRDCTGMAVAGGPGSFTGLRIACGLAQGLAYGAGLPVAVVGTLEALAEASGGDQVLACLDARMREVYWAAYGRTNDTWQELTAPCVSAPEEVRLPRGGTWVGVGSGFAAYPELRTRLGATLPLAAPLQPPLAGAVARLAHRRWTELAGDARAAQPAYVRNKVALTTAERAREGWR